MNHEFADCSFCGGRVREKLVMVDYRIGDKLVIVEDVPAGVCEQCGEQYFTAFVAKALEGLAHSEEAVQRTMTVPVKVFRATTSTA
ncbi:MAG: type II toxin-antitoxin system MqsA family antitoxin [Bacillota bacterium]